MQRRTHEDQVGAEHPEAHSDDSELNNTFPSRSEGGSPDVHERRLAGIWHTSEALHATQQLEGVSANRPEDAKTDCTSPDSTLLEGPGKLKGGSSEKRLPKSCEIDERSNCDRQRSDSTASSTKHHCTDVAKLTFVMLLKPKKNLLSRSASAMKGLDVPSLLICAHWAILEAARALLLKENERYCEFNA